MSHGAIEVYGLKDKQIENWCDKGCCPDCGRMLAEKFKKKEGQSDEMVRQANITTP